jgi:hypothetical protein
VTAIGCLIRLERLKEAGHSPVIYDNVARGHRQVIDILKVPAVVADLNDRATLTKALRDHKIVNAFSWNLMTEPVELKDGSRAFRSGRHRFPKQGTPRRLESAP